MSIELGLHSNNMNFMKSQSVRAQNIQRMRNIYSSSEKKSKFNNSIIERFSTTNSNYGAGNPHNNFINS